MNFAPHRWAKEIKAWTNGRPIQIRNPSFSNPVWTDCNPNIIRWEDEDYEFRIKPKENEMKTPTIYEVATHVAEHYGITKGQAFEIMRTPTHPAGLRDEFAGKAMQSYLTHPDVSEYSTREWAAEAYDMADAMLKERLK